MKRFITTILSLTMLLSIAVTNAIAFDDDNGWLDADTESPIELQEQLNYSEYEAAIPVLDNPDSSKTIDLFAPAEKRVLATNNRDYDVEVDILNAVNVTAEMVGTAAVMHENSVDNLQNFSTNADSSENQPPVANPQFLLVNPESLEDGQYTVGTKFFLATRLDGVDLCYDPEGGPLTLITNDSFPAGYISDYTEPNASLGGFFIHIPTPGSYPLVFAFVDEGGAASEILAINFDIVRRGSFETIDGTLSSATDQHQYNITVDFSNADEYYLGAIRTGLGGFRVAAYDSTGTRVNYVECGGPGPTQVVGGGIKLARPEGVTGEYTYTVQVNAIGAEYVEGNTAFQLAYGKSTQKHYFFEDVTNSIELPYYHQYRNYKQNLACYVQSNQVSDNGFYYKIDGTGRETVTLSSDTGRLDFKVLDATTFMCLYDTDWEGLVPHKVDGMSSYFTVKNLNFEAGKSYYIVVYDKYNTGAGGSYAITVGDHRINTGNLSCELPAAVVTANQPYTISFKITAPEGMNAYASMVSYQPNSPAWANNFAALSPGTTNWRTFGLMNLDYDYDNPNAPLVNAVGEWLLRVTPDKSGYYPGGTFRIYYICDVI